MSERAKPLSGTTPTDAFDVAVDMLTREQRRSRRKRDVRKKTISVARMTKRELNTGTELYPVEPSTRPATRAECAFVERPCPYVSCRFSLYLDVQPRTGSIVLNFPDLEPGEMAESCCLDVADRGGATLEEVGEYTNRTRELIRQVEVKAFAQLALLEEIAREVESEQRKPVRAHQQEAEQWGE